MRCPRCHSNQMVKIGHLTYCRNCISFGQVRLNQDTPQYPSFKELSRVYYDLDYDLSVEQKNIASQVIASLNKQQHVLIQAVCGSGKTELVYPCICHFLTQHKRVGFACPRKDLAIELYERLQSQLKGTSSVLVYGGHHDQLYAPLVVLTCHQLHRYWNYFDLLIIDEVDAFPFAGNQLLYQMARAANKGLFVLLSATSFENEVPKGFVKLTLDRRYHGVDLPIPKLVWLADGLFPIWLYFILKRWLKEDRLVLIFVPEKKNLDLLATYLTLFRYPFNTISSSTSNNEERLEFFRQHRYPILLTTTILERGVTFENVHVIVYRAHHAIYTTSTLIQIAGRVGRKPNYPTGSIYFVGKTITREMKQCKKRLIQKNAQSVSKVSMDYFKTKTI